MNLKSLNNEFPQLKELSITDAEWELIKENVEKYEDIRNLWNIINRREITTQPSDDFIKLVIENLNKISNSLNKKFSFDNMAKDIIKFYNN